MTWAMPIASLAMLEIIKLLQGNANAAIVPLVNSPT